MAEKLEPDFLQDPEEIRSHLISIVESSDDAIISRDMHGRIRSWNRGAERLFLYAPQEIIGLPISTLYPPEKNSDLLYLRTHVNRGVAIQPFELSAVRKDGIRVDVSVKVSMMYDVQGNTCGASVIARDISDQKRAELALKKSEERLRQAQKMEAIGNLAGGIAHDFNNVLSIILSYTQLVIDELQPNDPIRLDLEEIKKAGMRAGELTHQLLAFSRQQVLQPAVHDLNAILSDVEKMILRLLREDVNLSLFNLQATDRIFVDRGSIEQIIINLVVNARDAMPDGGSLVIETQNVKLDRDYAAANPDAVAGPYVMLAVTDTGVGMSPDVRQRIFDPFFTTKEKGKGTGLGLSIVYGIVQQSGGHISVYSEPGRGSTFKVFLPRTDRVISSKIPPAPSSSPRGGSETILVVEDEEQVRVVIRSILRKHGYNVLDTQNGGEAFLVCEKYASKIHLLLTDIVMPRMNGRELSERLLQLRPDMKLLYVSGYTENSIVSNGIVESGASFLQKPLTPESLLKKVREVLDMAPPSRH